VNYEPSASEAHDFFSYDEASNSYLPYEPTNVEWNNYFAEPETDLYYYDSYSNAYYYESEPSPYYTNYFSYNEGTFAYEPYEPVSY